MVGGGYMHGKFSEGDDWEPSGDQLAFIYPDMETAFFGNFTRFVMVEAVEAQVEEVDCNQNGLPTVTKFKVSKGPKYFYKPPSNKCFGAGPFGKINNALKHLKIN